MESACLGLVSRPFSGAGIYGCPVSPPGTLMTEEFEEELNADAQQAKPLPIPAKPTPEMIAAHEVSHLPFRSWCSHCVRGRGKSFQHRRVQHDQDDEAHPVVSLDYAFFGAPGELEQEAIGGAKMPVLVVKDRFSKAMFTHLLPSKGIEHFYPEAALLRDIRFLGYAQLTLKSDQEPAILTLTNAVKSTLSARGVILVVGWRTRQREMRMACQMVSPSRL